MISSPQHILSVNAGSSSLKCKLFRVSEDKSTKPLVTIKVSGVGTDQLDFTFDPKSQETTNPQNVSSHEEAFAYILKQLQHNKDKYELGDLSDLVVAHRIVHGGNFGRPAKIDDETYHELEKLESLAPLHNASGLAIIKSCRKEIPHADQITVFDTLFHQTLPSSVSTYAIDQKIAKEKGLRKYGFHGISYRYILRTVAAYLKQSEETTNLIVMHLGSGSSICAIREGTSIDTSMGLTPVSGLPGGSRSGDIDPSLVFHYTSSVSELSHSSTKELHITKAEDILNKQSGWKALTGTSDFSKIASSDAKDVFRLAFDIFVDRILGYVGSFYVKLDGKVDALVFSGGIGENNSYLREEIVKRLDCLGFTINSKTNQEDGKENSWEIGSGQKKIMVCKTDEEEEMTRYVLDMS